MFYFRFSHDTGGKPLFCALSLLSLCNSCYWQLLTVLSYHNILHTSHYCHTVTSQARHRLSKLEVEAIALGVQARASIASLSLLPMGLLVAALTLVCFVAYERPEAQKKEIHFSDVRVISLQQSSVLLPHIPNRSAARPRYMQM